ncbi:hypothetical protein SAMN02745181_2709 [Rubritalea squalenifaciens DSM 18772]|uniref:Uncharacterized protein n=1 Tax=Rubritalea squalenifaciens DSM 18772 TaxID=1123071 RepID=A0A1M6MF47_9BACT|nr:hypothetical protein [Rubritalea squalenifaciens]SHJ81970.1 hypothetical protein SAMN02745181_2709 [Rubritalea squalenifaciens DSM 18772]
MSEEKPKTEHLAPLPESLRIQLEQFRKQLWRIKILEATMAGLFGLLFSYILVYGLDRFWPTPPLVRLIILITGVSLFAIFAPIWINRWVFKHRRENQLARLIARHYPRLGDRLLGVVELQDQNEAATSMSPRLRAAAMEEVAKAARERDLDRALPASSHHKWGLVVVLLFFLTVIAGVMSPDASFNALKRWLLPLSDTERFTYTKLDKDQLPQPYHVPHGEDYSIDFQLTKDSDKPDEAKARQGMREWQTVKRNDRTYAFDFKGQSKDETVNLRIGDSYHDILVKPVYRPTLTEISAKVEYPEYLQRKAQVIDLSSGVATILEGSKVTVMAKADRDLSAVEAGPMEITPILEAIDAQELPEPPSAEEETAKPSAEASQPTFQELKATYSGNHIKTDSFHAVSANIKLPLNWTDKYGITAREKSVLTFNSQKDMEPHVYIQGVPSEIFKLAEETLTFEIQAEDDYGLKAAGIEWQGEFTKPTAKTPAKGELTLIQGAPDQTTLTDIVDFSFEAYNIEPQKLTLRAWTEDYKTDRGRIYSAPVTVYILTRDEHRQLIERRTKDAINRLEDLMRNEQESLDENKRLDRKTGEELQKDENRDKLGQQENAELDNADRMKDLAEEMEDIFKEATRNGDIDTDTMKKLAESAEQMKEMAEKEMPDIAQKLQDSQNQRNTQEKTDQDVQDAVKKQEELLQKMQETISKANEANKQLEAGTFVNRLKKAASEEDGIANILIRELNRSMDASEMLIGLSYEDLDPEDQRTFLELYTQQDQTNSDVRWIQEDLGHFYSRTQKEVHKKLLDSMRESAIDDRMDILKNDIKKAQANLSMNQAKDMAEQLRKWAKELENANDQGGGGGGGGGQSNNEDQDFEFMLKVMKMIQKEQDIRARTRSLEQLKRALENNPTVPSPTPIP